MENEKPETDNEDFLNRAYAAALELLQKVYSKEGLRQAVRLLLKDKRCRMTQRDRAALAEMCDAATLEELIVKLSRARTPAAARALFLAAHKQSLERYPPE